MDKGTLRYIKNDMWETLYNKKHLQAILKKKLKELEAERKEALVEYKDLPEDDWYREYCIRTTNERFDGLITRMLEEEFSQWHNDQSYYLIYKDGSDACITAEEILGGEKFPKMSDIVYAELYSADDSIDTEKGELDWYSEEALEACDYDYGVEDERKWQYETAIQFKFHTEWSIRYRQINPDFVPVEI